MYTMYTYRYLNGTFLDLSQLQLGTIFSDCTIQSRRFKYGGTSIEVENLSIFTYLKKIVLSL